MVVTLIMGIILIMVHAIGGGNQLNFEFYKAPLNGALLRLLRLFFLRSFVG